MKKIILVICLILSLVMLVCACNTSKDTDTDSSVNCDSQPDSNVDSTVDSTADSAADSSADSTVDVNDGKYRIFVCDENGNGLNEIFVQYCKEDVCLFGYTDANGYLEISSNEYHVALVLDESEIYESKEYTEQDYVYFKSGSKLITITLTKK